MADILKPDLCVIGAGACGTALAMRARERGVSVVLVERPTAEPGDPASGRLARAAFLASASRAEALRSAEALGIDKAEPKLNFRTIGERAAAVAAGVAPRLSAERLAALGVTALQGDPVFKDRQTLSLGDTLVRARRFVLATGAVPAVPQIPGLDQIAYFTPDSILSNMRKLTHLVVIGGDANAVELAQAYRRLGSSVTLVPHGPLLAGFDSELVTILVRALRQEGLTILEGAEVAAIVPRSQGTGVTLRGSEGTPEALDASHVLLALERQPDIDGDWLDKAKLRRDTLRPDRLALTERCETSNGRISAIGGAAGELRPHAAARQADIVLDHLLSGAPSRFNPAQVPLLLASEPGLAQVGQLELSRHLRAGQTILRANLAENDGVRSLGEPGGVVKVVIGPKGNVLGGAALGPASAEIAAMLALAMEKQFTIADFAGLSLPATSSVSTLADIGRQYLAQRPASAWTQRMAALRRLMP